MTAVTILASAIGIQTLLNIIPAGRLLRPVSGHAFVVVYVACRTAILPTAFRGDRLVQEFVENEIRKLIGLYLSSVMGPRQTLGCESLRYFGYYSPRLVYDYPGLANPSVVQLMRENRPKRRLIEMLEHFRPDCIVMRCYEYAGGLQRGYLWLRTDCYPIRAIRIPDGKIREMLSSANNIDLDFFVHRRKP